MSAIHDLLSDLKKQNKCPSWKLFISAFPLWIPPEHTWPNDYGVPISFNEIDQATESDGKISIQFHQDDKLIIVNKFLQDWETGVCDVKTNTRKSPDELMVKVTLVDENNLFPNKAITLRYPTNCSYSVTTSCIAVYSITN